MQAEQLECITGPTPAQRQIDAIGPEILVTSVIVLYVREVEHGIEVGELVDGIALFVSEIVVRADEFVVHKVLKYLPEVTVVVCRILCCREKSKSIQYLCKQRPNDMIDEKKALELIALGEGQHIEFKEAVPSKVRELSEEVCAFSNATGGYIFIGVNNKSDFVKGFTIDNTKRSSIQDSLDAIQPAVYSELYPLTVKGREIWVIEVQEGDQKPYVASGSIFVRRGANSQKLRTPTEIRQLFDDAGALHYDEAMNKWFKMEEVSTQAVRAFKEKAGITSTSPDSELIWNMGLLGKKGEMTNVVPMFFSDECGKRIPQAVVRCVLFKGTNKVHIIDSKTIGGPLLSQYNETTKWLKQRLAVEYIMDGFNSRIEKWEIPLDAIKEALTNSICHRDYYDTAANIMVELYDDRLEISNPGGLLPIVAKNFGHMSKSRNPKVFELFTRMDLVEKVGSGIPRMTELMRIAGLPAPEYHTEGSFTTVLYKKSPASSQNVIENVIENVGRNLKGRAKREQIILELMRRYPGISLAELARSLNVSERTVARDVVYLRETKKIARQGGDKGGEWRIIDDRGEDAAEATGQ